MIIPPLGIRNLWLCLVTQTLLTIYPLCARRDCLNMRIFDKCKSTSFEIFTKNNCGSGGLNRSWKKTFTTWFKPFQSQFAIWNVWFTNVEILKSLESLAEGSLYWNEKLNLSMLTLFAILGCFHILCKAVSSVRTFTYGVPFHGVDYLMNPFAPFLRTMDRHCEIMQLNNPVSSVPN